MGLYINPMKGTKEDWLMKKGRQVCILLPEVALPDFKSFTEKGELPVILVNNGTFTAAGVAFNEQEYEIMTESERDTRPKILFAVSKKKLKKVSNLKDYLKE